MQRESDLLRYCLESSLRSLAASLFPPQPLVVSPVSNHSPMLIECLLIFSLALLSLFPPLSFCLVWAHDIKDFKSSCATNLFILLATVQRGDNSSVSVSVCLQLVAPRSSPLSDPAERTRNTVPRGES